MSLRVIYEEKAIDQAAGFLADDPAGLGAVLDAIDALDRVTNISGKRRVPLFA